MYERWTILADGHAVARVSARPGRTVSRALPSPVQAPPPFRNYTISFFVPDVEHEFREAADDSESAQELVAALRRRGFETREETPELDREDEDPPSDHETSRRTEGPTPAGGAYAIAYFFHDGTPSAQRFADAIEIVEYDEADNAIKRTYARTAPPTVAVPSPGDPPRKRTQWSIRAALLRRSAPRRRPAP